MIETDSETHSPILKAVWDSYGRIGEGLKTLKVQGTPQEDQKIQLGWAFGTSERLSLEPNNTLTLTAPRTLVYMKQIRSSV